MSKNRRQSRTATRQRSRFERPVLTKTKALGLGEFVSLGRRLEEIDERIGWCDGMLADLSESEAAAYITLAREHYGSVKELLLDSPSLSYEAIRGELEFFRDEVELPPINRFKAALMIVESGVLQDAKLATVAGLAEPARKLVVRWLKHLLIEFVKSRRNAIACPKCHKKKTHYREYTIVFDSHAMECDGCGHLWKIAI